VNSDGVYSSNDPRPHATVSASTKSMRAKKQSIVHHIYFDKTIASESCPEGVYSGHRIHGAVVPDPRHVRDSYDTARSHRSVFDDIPAGKTAVGYAPHLKSYYVPDASGQNQQLIKLLPHPSEPETWYFTNPNTNESTLTLFPIGCGIPLPTQLPSTPEPDDPVPATIPSHWETPGEASGSATDQELAKNPIENLVDVFDKAQLGESTAQWSWSKQWKQWERKYEIEIGTWKYEYKKLSGDWSDWRWSEDWQMYKRYTKDPDGNWGYDYEPIEEADTKGKKKSKGKGK
jgi:hypothetical protein